MVDIERLKGIMREKGVTVEEAAETIGMHPSTLYRRLQKDQVWFTVTEANRLADWLGMDARTCEEVFLGADRVEPEQEATDNSGGHPGRKVPEAVNQVLDLCKSLEKQGYEVEYHISDSSDGNHQIRMEALKRFSRLRWT